MLAEVLFLELLDPLRELLVLRVQAPILVQEEPQSVAAGEDFVRCLDLANDLEELVLRLALRLPGFLDSLEMLDDLDD